MIRLARKEDVAAVAAVYEEIHTEEEQGNVTIGWKRGIYPTLETAAAAFRKNELFVMEENGAVVGAAIINQRQVDSYKDGSWTYDAPDSEVMVLHTLVISPGGSGKGCGRRFVRFYEEYARSQNCPHLRMDTNANNARARAMYKKLGYCEIGIVPCVFNGLENVPLVLLEKKL